MVTLGCISTWQILRNLPSEPEEAISYLKTALSNLNYRYLFLADREGEIPPLKASRAYDKYGPHQFPKIKGTILLHQLHLLLGNATFSKLMNTIHNQFANKKMTMKNFMLTANKISNKPLDSFIKQWLGQTGLPSFNTQAKLKKSNKQWTVSLTIIQNQPIYHFFTTVSIETNSKIYYKLTEIKDEKNVFNFTFDNKPLKININPISDVPVKLENFYSFSNILDEFNNLMRVYGTARQIEANHTIALRYQTVIADAYTEILPPIKKDSELTSQEALTNDLIILEHPSDNSFLRKISDKIPLKFKHNMFIYDNKIYAEPDDGIMLALPNPYNPKRIAYIIIANSALQLYKITKKFYRGSNYAIFKGEKILEEGYNTLPSISIGNSTK